MMVGSAILSFCMMMITILLSLNKEATSSASIAFFFVYMLVFGATINVVPWVWGPEILPLEARARGTAISVSSHWMWNFCTSTTRLWLLSGEFLTQTLTSSKASS